MSADSSRVTAAARRRHLGLVTLGIGALLAPLISATDIPPAQATGSAAVAVTGGDVTDYDGYRYHLFTHTGGVAESTDYTLTVTGNTVFAEVLVVAGGGGGGRNRAGGGGAGGVLHLADEDLTVGDYSITVGGGGKGGFPAVGPWNSRHYSPGCQGESSSFDGKSVDGGGGGGAEPGNTTSDRQKFECDGDGTPISGEDFSGTPTSADGGSGGSGGGGAYNSGLAGVSTASGEAKGNDGSAGSTTASQAGGGGGAGAPGALSNGGAGTQEFSDFGKATQTGHDVDGTFWFAGGGAGFGSPRGVGGHGGGGSSSGNDLSGYDGMPDTGGGGGACANAAEGCRGGHGGSGVVIVRYEVPHFTELDEPHTEQDTLTRSFGFGSTMGPIGLTGADSVEVVSGTLPTGISLGDYENDAVAFTGSATEVGTFEFTLRAFQNGPADGPTLVTDRVVTVTVSPVAPDTPSALSVSDKDGDTILSFTPPTNGGGATVSYEATVDGGTTWTALESDGGDWLYPDLDRTRQQPIQVRAVNSAGASEPTSAVVFPLFMLNNNLFRVGGGKHNADDFNAVASIGANGQIVQPFYFDVGQSRWARMTYGSAPFDFAIGFGTGNEPTEASPYDPDRNWTGATVYGTFQSSDPFQSPIPGSSSVTVEGFSCEFPDNSPVCIGTGTIIASADFTLGDRVVRVVNRYTLSPGSRFLSVVTSVKNPDGSPLTNVNVWVGTRDDWVGIKNDGGDNAQGSPGRYRADLPQKFRGTISDGFFQTLSSSNERASALLLESIDGVGVFYSTSPGVNSTVAPCCQSLQAFADATSSARGTNASRGFENAVVLNPSQSAIATPLPSSAFKRENSSAEFFQNRRTDLRDAGYALHLPLGTIPGGESNSATWFLGGAAYTERTSLLGEVSQAAPVAAQGSVGRGTLTVDLTSAPAPAGTIGYEIRLRDGDGLIIDTVQVLDQSDTFTFSNVANGVSYQVDLAPLSGPVDNPVVGERTLFSDLLIPDPPANTAVPTISGTVAAGTTLEASAGQWEWDGAELSTTYQWQRNEIDIDGATQSSYTIPQNVGSGEFRVVVTRQVAGGVPVSAVSTPVGFDPDANLIVEEYFNSALSEDEWVLTGSAEVTGGNLQLTPKTNRQAGAAFYVIPQQTEGGIDATFVINQREGTGADGMTFFLKDGENTSTTPGPAGSRLGFNAGGTTPGISGALVGIGFDRFGSFIRADRVVSPGEFTCPNLGGTNSQGGNSRLQNNLTLRGPGEGLEGYCKLIEGVRNSTTAWQDTERTIRFRYDPTATPATKQIQIWVDGIEDLDTPLISTTAPAELLAVDTFKFGFTASTGGSNNIHEVKFLRVEAANALAPLRTVQNPELPPALVNEAFSKDLGSLFQGGVQPFTFSMAQGELPPGLSINSPLSGTPTAPGLYEFTLEARDRRPAALQSTVLLDLTLQVNAGQTITFPTLPFQSLSSGTLNAGATTNLNAPGSLPGLAPSYTTSTSDVCEVTPTGVISLLARGECRITARQDGGSRDGYDILPAPDVERVFTVFDPALSSLALSAGTLSPAFNQATNQYSVTVPNNVSTLTITPTSRFAGSDIAVGGAPTNSGTESAPIPLAVGSNTLVLTVTDGDAVNTITISATRAAPPAPPAGNQTSRPTPPAVTAPAPGSLTIPRPPTTSPVLGAPAPAPVAAGPVITGGQPPRPTGQTTATVGGTPRPVSQAPIGSTGVRVTAGTLDIGVRVTSNQQGTVRTTPEGTPELVVVKGQQTVISGTGVAPGSTVQAFLPLNGTNAIELGRIQADATGTFNGQAVLNTPLTEAPLPVGRQVLQILGVDDDGNQTVVNMTINIAQPPPEPEINRENQEVPTLGVGQSLATEAGIPVAVTVTPVPENKQTLIEGDGWTMGISVAGEGAEVDETAEGEVVLKLVRDETASVSGSGFMPLTRADVWLFSEPTLLGTVDIDENGEFNGVVNVDGNVVTVGEHTLQLQGVGQDGYVRAANLGVLVGENPELVPTTTATSSLTWLLWAIALFAVAAIIALFWWLRRQGATNS